MPADSKLATQLKQTAPGLSSQWDRIEAAVEVLANAFGGGGSGQFAIPPFDSQTFSYFGSTNNVETIVYKNGADTVATLTFTYVGGGSADDDNVASITQS